MRGTDVVSAEDFGLESLFEDITMANGITINVNKVVTHKPSSEVLDAFERFEAKLDAIIASNERLEKNEASLIVGLGQLSAEVTRVEKNLEALHDKVDKLAEELLPGQAVKLGMKFGKPTEQA